MIARARLMWAEHFAAPRHPRQMTGRKRQATEAATARKLHGRTEAARQRQRQADLVAQLWGPNPDKELARQKALAKMTVCGAPQTWVLWQRAQMTYGGIP